MKNRTVKSTYISWSVIALGISFLSLLWFNYFHQKRLDKEETISSAVQRNSNLAVALEQYTIRTIHNADAVLQLIKIEYKNKGRDADLKELLLNNAVNQDVFKAVCIIDEKGDLIETSVSKDQVSNRNVSDREFYKYHQSHDTDILYISKPFVSKWIDKPVINISRRITVAGNFFGIAVVQLLPATFTSFYAQANLLPRDIISLIAPDGTTYARRTGSIESQGEDISNSPLFEHLTTSPDSFYYARDAIHGIPTWFSYRKLKAYPVIATVGRAEQDVLKDYYKRLQREFISTVLISILIVLFSFVVLLFLQHREKAERRKREDEQVFQQQLTKQVMEAQEKERESIGYELHDNVNQILTSSKLYLEIALVNQENKDHLVSKSIDMIVSCIKEIRSLSHRLSAPALGTGSLVDSLSALLETVSTSSGIKVEFNSIQYTSPLGEDKSFALYRIAQEQLNNVVRHSGATNLKMHLWQDDHQTYLTISDNGKGFNPKSAVRGIGIHNMIGRAKMFNGMIEIESAPGKGCMLKVIIPLKEAG